MEKDKRVMATSVIAVVTLLVAIIGTTFAFFTLTIRGNDEASSIMISSGVMGNVVFEDGTAINWENVLLLKDSATEYKDSKKFYIYTNLLTDDPEITVNIPYEIYLVEFENTLSVADKTYYSSQYFLHSLKSLPSESTKLTDDEMADDGEDWLFPSEVQLAVPTMDDENMVTLNESDLPAGTKGYLLGTGVISSKNSRHAYEYSVELKNDNSNLQNELQNKKFVGKLYVKLGEPTAK